MILYVSFISIYIYIFGRKYYTLDQVYNKNECLHKYQSSFNSVQYIDIKSKQSIVNCNNYFSNATQLIFNDILSTSHTTVASTLSLIVPLKQLTKLIIECNQFSFRKLIKILRYAPNIHVLELRSMVWYEKKNRYTSIRQSEDFQIVSQTNTITNITCDTERTIDQIKLLVALCPRIQYFATNTLIRDLEAIVRFLLDKDNQNTRHLHSLHLTRDHCNFFDKINSLIKTESLFDDCTLIKSDLDVYLWW